MTASGIAAVLLVLLLAGAGDAALVGPPRSEPGVTVLRDLLAEFPHALRINAPSVDLHPLARTHAHVLPSISLHPTGKGDTIIRYPALALPRLHPGERILVLMRVAMSDGIPWKSETRPNGVRFSLAVGEQVMWEEDVTFTGWQWRVMELTPWAGKRIALDLRSNAIDGNAAYDWFLVAQPRIVRYRGTTDAGMLVGNAAGYALARVRSDGPAVVRLKVGEAVTQASVSAGTHCVAVRFNKPAAPVCEITEGAAEILGVELAPASYDVRVGQLATGQALVTVGRRVEVTLPLANSGDGTYPGGDDAVLPDSGGGYPATTPTVAPGACGVVRWDDLRFTRPGRYPLTAALAGERRTLDVTVLPCAELPRARPDRPRAQVIQGQATLGVAGNASARVCVIVDPNGSAGALAQTWNGQGWQTVGSLSPLARLQVASPGGSGELDLTFAPPRAVGEKLYVTARGTDPGGESWTVRLALRPDGDAPRIHWDCRARCNAEAGLMSFVSPSLAAGDGAFGERKEFALFPGLEYLEGDEPSSSPRDLAPPLHDRRAPRADKIAVPLMAAQGGGALVGLLWDARQEWAPGQSLPSARFQAPAYDSGPRYLSMSLAAPGIGEYVPENALVADKPCRLRAGQTIRLRSTLVLDHVSRYVEGHVARGPHGGGLITQAFRNWVEVFGLPPLQPLPRSWEAVRELSREAYLRTLWSEYPPGWPPFAGQPVGHDTESLAPLLMELQAGVDEATRGEIQRRMEAVAEYTLRERGPGSLLQGNRVLLPFHYGYLSACLRDYRGFAHSLLNGREDGLWLWRPGDAEHAGLGIPGTHTLGQAAYPCLVVLRAARFLGDRQLTLDGLAALRQMEQYEVPRGASMWECPQYQPDIFAAALAIKAYIEAYRITGDQTHLDHARYWAWTGLPFIYTWGLEGYPTMPYNAVGVIGSTYYTHSWIGRPLVWMGMDYAYALQDLAPHDHSFQWLRVAEGITRSAMWQQYADGPSKGLFPDSWEMATNQPNPADILPTLILTNAHRLRGLSLEVRFARLGEDGSAGNLNSSADILGHCTDRAGERLEFTVQGVPGFPAHSVLAQVPEPASVEGAGSRVSSDEELQALPEGWLYDPELRAVIVKQTRDTGPATATVLWPGVKGEASGKGDGA